MHSQSCFVGLVGVFLPPFSLPYRLGFFLYNVGNRVSFSPFFVNSFCSVFTDKKKKINTNIFIPHFYMIIHMGMFISK